MNIDYAVLGDVEIMSTVRAIPSCPVERKSVVMGSVWTFKPTEEYDFPTLCVSRMVRTASSYLVFLKMSRLPS